MTIPSYPLQWPAGWKRAPAGSRVRARFGKASRSSGGSEGRWPHGRLLTINEGVDRVRAVLKKLNVHDDDFVISSNLQLRLDGLPRSGQGEPSDQGVAVYWLDKRDRNAPPKCMAVDQYDRVADNLAAVAATLDAMRAIERHGGAEILERAFIGFVALPPPEAIDWRQVLDPADPVGSFKRLRSTHHPDKGGDADEFNRVNRAYQAYCKEQP